MWKYTTILHAVRADLKITCFEYCILDYIYHRQTYPKARVPGWCTDSRQSMGDAVGITRQYVIKVIKKLSDRGLLEAGQKSIIRTTGLWYDAAYILDRKEPDPADIEQEPHVNKVYSNGKQSLHPPVNKVYSNGKQSLLHLLKVNNLNKGEESNPPPIFHRSDGFVPPTLQEVTKYYTDQYVFNSSRFYNARESDLESIAFTYINARERINWNTPAGVPIKKWQPDSINYLVSFGRNMNGDKDKTGTIKPPSRANAAEVITNETRWRVVECDCGTTFAVDINKIKNDRSTFRYACPEHESGRCNKSYTSAEILKMIENGGIRK